MNSRSSGWLTASRKKYVQYGLERTAADTQELETSIRPEDNDSSEGVGEANTGDAGIVNAASVPPVSPPRSPRLDLGPHQPGIVNQRIFSRLYPLILCSLQSEARHGNSVNDGGNMEGKIDNDDYRGTNNIDKQKNSPPTQSRPSHFAFKDCYFNVERSKKGTGRIVCWRDIQVRCVVFFSLILSSLVRLFDGF